MPDSPAAQGIWQVAADLRMGGLFERSVKISRNGVSYDRALASLPIEVLGNDRAQGLAQLAAPLDAPDLSVLAADASKAISVHIGADDATRKVYLEFHPSTTPAENLVFLALKWRGPDVALHRYHSISHLPHTQKQQILQAHISDPPTQDAALELLDLARAGDPDDEAVVLQVSDDSSPRLSFDISVADAGRSLGSMQALLAPLVGSLGHSWNAMPRQAHADLLGHVAIGQDAKAQPFVMLYHGARPI